MIRFQRAALAAATALALALTSQPAAAFEPATIWVKAGASPDATIAAQDDCVAKSKSVRAEIDPNAMSRAQSAAMATRPGAASAVGAAIGVAIAIEMANAAAQRASIPKCMHALGYVRLRVSAREAAADHGAATSEKRAAVLQAIYASPDFAARFAVAARPVAPLPAAGADTLIFRDYRMDPSALTAVSGVVEKGAVLDGPVARRATATLTTELKWDGFPDVIPAGTVMQAAVVPGPDGAALTYWCWHHAFGRGSQQYCVRTDAQGEYHITRTIGGYRALLMPPAPALDKEGFNDVDFVLTPAAQDTLPPMRLTLYVRKVGDDGVKLAIETSADKQSAIIWSQLVPFDAKGQAVVPFWTHRLVLRRSGAGVSVAYAPDGDGTPLPADDPAQCQPGWVTGCV